MARDGCGGEVHLKETTSSCTRGSQEEANTNVVLKSANLPVAGSAAEDTFKLDTLFGTGTCSRESPLRR